MAPQYERRRSQRVILRVAVKLHLNVDGKPSVLRACTANVNDHGALLISPENFAVGARFVLEQESSHQRIACRVTRSPRTSPDGFQVAVEFEKPVPGFWHITFPPPDWKSSDS